MAGIPDKTIIFRKFDLWWPLLTSILTWAKKWPKWLRTGSLRAVDRRIARPSSFPSFRVRGGGHFGPPPPWRRWLRPPPGRGLSNKHKLFYPVTKRDNKTVWFHRTAHTTSSGLLAGVSEAPVSPSRACTSPGSASGSTDSCSFSSTGL